MGVRRFAILGVQSIGLTSDGSRMNVKRDIVGVWSIGISPRSYISVLPYLPPGLGGMILLEASDAGIPTNFASLVPRESSSIFIDTTRTIYPNPYTLLN
jgi:hypothetical protein